MHSSQRPRQRFTRERRSTWKAGRLALGMLTVLGGVSYVGVQSAAAARFSPDEQRIVAELPFGFSERSCETAASAPPESVASLDCGQDAGLSGPLGGHFTSFGDPDALNRAFQDDLTRRGPGYVPSPCPGLDASPATWHYDATPGTVAGHIVCGTFEGAPDIEWTRDRELLLLNVHDGRDLGDLYQWWDRYGNAVHETFTR